eukprot:m.302600 g.302600  ORF g.302600 m.302600 type:complete len:276 (-) comp15285_c0_seq1:120-947(-)
MASLLDDATAHFGTSELYEVLGVSKTATESEVKKAYHRLALRWHPDKAPADAQDDFKAKFQTASAIYAVLSDAEKRKLYDETGQVEDDLGMDKPTDQTWYDYWRSMFARVNTDDIESFAEKYRHSEQEQADLKVAYLKAEGDMDVIFSHVMCSNVLEDESRFRETISKWIANGEIPNHDAFSKEPKKKRDARRRKAQKEAKEAEASAAGMASLEAAILQRHKARPSILQSIEERYAGKKERKRKAPGKSASVEPSEEEFLNIQRQLERNKKRRNS